MLSDEAKEWKSKMPTVPSASLIRIEQDKVLDKVWIENKRIEGKLSEEQLISILTRLRYAQHIDVYSCHLCDNIQIITITSAIS